MRDLFLSNKKQKVRLAFGLFVIFGVLAGFYLSILPEKKVMAQKADSVDSQGSLTVFSNPAPISPVDRPSNSAGTNPGLPALYPSPIAVAGLTGVVSKVTVTFSITSTFPDDFDILLVGPTGARSLVMSDAGGSGDHTNISYTFDQTAATTMPNDPTTVVPTGTFQPSNFLGFATPEPGGQDNFPTVGGLMSYPTTFVAFNGTNPNGTWNLYVVDDQVIDNVSLPSGWSIDITMAVPDDAPVDVNGDGKTDYVIVRNTGGGPGGQLTWFVSENGSGAISGYQWGLQGDEFVPEDYDGDNKDDIAVWRPAPGSDSTWYVLNSATQTARVEPYGLSTDDPSVVDDYNGDGKADLAVYRTGTVSCTPTPTPACESNWLYRTTTGGTVTTVRWGQNGDFPVPGDFSGDGSADFVVQRNSGGGQARFFVGFNAGGTLPPTVQPTFVFGTPTDLVRPGDYDGDDKVDVAVTRGESGNIAWYIRRSIDGAIVGPIPFGISATDFPAQGDYDGDGTTDIAVWRPDAAVGESRFWIRNTVSGAVSVFTWGQNGDYPVANYNNH